MMLFYQRLTVTYLLSISLIVTEGFSVVGPSRAPTLLAAQKKGFGKDEPKVVIPEAKSEPDAPVTPQPVQKTAGQKALEEMRRQRAEQKDEELRRIRELRQADQQVSTQGSAIPEKVAQRMGKRMLPFVGAPLFLGMGSFVLFWYFATYKNLEFQPAVVAGTTIGILALSLVGITYSVLSASWDPDREGSFLGTEEFQQNMQNIKDGLKRSRDNAILRDQMANLSEEEIGKALSDLERREAQKEKKGQSLTSKLKDELD